MLHSPLYLLILVSVCVGLALDLTRRRLPNWLTVTTAFAGLVTQAVLHGWDGVLDGLSGLGLAVLLFLPLWLGRWMGAGDVKMLMAVGACLGWRLGLVADLASLVIGVVASLAFIAVRGELFRFFHRYLSMLYYWVAAGERAYIAPQPGEAASQRFPYALAIAFGVLVALYGPGNLTLIDEWFPLLMK